VTPNEYSVKVYQNGKLLDGNFTLDTIPYDLLDISSLRIVISAKWTNLDGGRGSAEYSFSTVVGKTPEFFLKANTTLTGEDESTVLMGEFFTVVATNVSAPEKIEFSSSPEIDFSPSFFKDGDMVYALVPIPNDKNAPLEYTFTFSYSGIKQSFEVNALPRTVKSRDYECDKITVSRNDASIDEYERLLSEIGLKCEEMKYFGSDKFIDYEVYYDSGDATIILGYGNERIPDNGDERFILDGVDFGMGSGHDVRAIAAGKVVYSGSCKLLGSFIVVDHGFGLKTWYCHLESAIIAVGETVQKGAVIGSSGKTGYTNTNGVYLITTVLDTPICPYSLQESGMTFPQTNN
jgi:murein DD-endopeptidase MepM/ murein hydrolase activator NlpD